MPDYDAIKQIVADYYASKLQTHGATHQGVDWNSTESQHIRFNQITKVITPSPAGEPCTILDYGCGYGALIDYLEARHIKHVYTGFDIAPEMIAAAVQIFSDRGQFTSDVTSLEPVDYVMASGIFNVKLKTSEKEWSQYILKTLDHMWALSKRGMSFNSLTSYSDAEYMRDDLHYSDPMFLFDYCMRNFSRHVALLHDYGLYEFTILVRREGDPK